MDLKDNENELWIFLAFILIWRVSSLEKLWIRNAKCKYFLLDSSFLIKSGLDLEDLLSLLSLEIIKSYPSIITSGL